MQDLQQDLDDQMKKNSTLKCENENLCNHNDDQAKNVQKQKTLVKQLESMKDELQMELETSEDAREQLKMDLNDANEKIIQIEEELYESKTIQLELLENLK